MQTCAEHKIEFRDTRCKSISQNHLRLSFAYSALHAGKTIIRKLLLWKTFSRNFSLFTVWCIIYNLYKDGSFTFSTLLSLIHVILLPMLYYINADIPDVSAHSLHIQNACEITKCLRTLFVSLNIRLNNMLKTEQCVSLQIKDASTDFSSDNLPIIKDALLQSPRIKFSFTQDTDDDLFYEKLYSPLKEGTR